MQTASRPKPPSWLKRHSADLSTASTSWTESRKSTAVVSTESEDENFRTPERRTRNSSPLDETVDRGDVAAGEDGVEASAEGKVRFAQQTTSFETMDGQRKGARRASITSSATSAGERLNVEDIFGQDVPPPRVESPYAFMYRNSKQRPLSVHARRMMRKTWSDKDVKSMKASPGPWFNMRLFGDRGRDSDADRAGSPPVPLSLETSQSLPTRLSRRISRPGARGRKVEDSEIGSKAGKSTNLATAAQAPQSVSGSPIPSNPVSSATSPVVSLMGVSPEARARPYSTAPAKTDAEIGTGEATDMKNSRTALGAKVDMLKDSPGAATQRVDSPAFEEELKYEGRGTKGAGGLDPPQVKSQDVGRDSRSVEVDDRYESDLQERVTSMEKIPKMDRFGFFAWDHAPQESISAAEEDQRLLKEAERESKWIHMLERWEKYRPSKKLKQRLRKGVPNKLRGRLWAVFAGAELRMRRSPHLYEELCKPNDKIAVSVGQQIDRDIYRTFPQHFMFRVNFDDDDEDPQNPCLGRVDSEESCGGARQTQPTVDPSDTEETMAATSGAGGVLQGTVDCGPGIFPLRRVLQAYARYDPELGYCQAMNYLAALCLMYMPEEEAFHTMCYLMNRKHGGFRGLYLPQMPLARVMFHALAALLRKVDGQLWRHFQSINLQVGDFFVPWLFTLFAGQFPFALVARVWDVILHCGMEDERDFIFDVDKAESPSEAAPQRSSFLGLFGFTGGADKGERGHANGVRAKDKQDRRYSSASAASSLTHATRRDDDSISPEHKGTALGDVSAYKVILRISLALICENRRDLLRMDFSDAMVYLVSEVPRNTDSERIVKRAFSIQLTSSEVRSCMQRAANEICGGNLDFAMGIDKEVERIRVVGERHSANCIPRRNQPAEASEQP